MNIESMSLKDINKMIMEFSNYNDILKPTKNITFNKVLLEKLLDENLPNYHKDIFETDLSNIHIVMNSIKNNIPKYDNVYQKDYMDLVHRVKEFDSKKTGSMYNYSYEMYLSDKDKLCELQKDILELDVQVKKLGEK